MTWTPNCVGSIYYETYPYENPYGSGSSPFVITNQPTGSGYDWWLVGPNWDWICETGVITVEPWPLSNSSSPTVSPTFLPSAIPTIRPTLPPSAYPTYLTPLPTSTPVSFAPISVQPTSNPSLQPTVRGVTNRNDDDKLNLFDSMWFVLVIGIAGGAVLMAIVGIIYYKMIIQKRLAKKSFGFEFSSPIHNA